MCSLELGKSIMKCIPFVSALNEKQKSFRCDQCFKSICESFECKTCSEYWFCSELCRNKNWISHQFECGLDLRELIRTKCNDPSVRDETDWYKFNNIDEYVTHTQLLLYILFKFKCDPNCSSFKYLMPNGLSVSYDDIKAPNCDKMHKVWDNSDSFELIDEVTYNFGAWLTVCKQILDLQDIKARIGSVSQEVLMRAFRIVVRYALYVCDNTFINVIGKALYIELCFITHSCVPNCGPLFDENNELVLYLLDPKVEDFSELKYDYQIEMSGQSAQRLHDSLYMRNIECFCKRCLNKKQFSVDYREKLTEANLRYGNWPQIDYCLKMKIPVQGLVDDFTYIYGNYHPMVTSLLLCKFHIEIVSFNFGDEKNAENHELLEDFEKLLKAIFVTHGSDHVWLKKLGSIENYLKFICKSNQDLMETEDQNFSNYIETIESTIDEIIPIKTIASKLV